MIDLTIQVAEALDAAHRRGIIHRDIKPANLFVTHGDRVKVLDFGLAKLATDAPSPAVAAPSAPTLTGIVYSPDLTRTGSTVGTASYMAPEQAQGQPVDARTDLFSLGTVLYEMATGRRAFGGEDIPLIVMKIVNGIVVAPRTVNESVPQNLEAIILKLMALDPNARYQSAGELLTDLHTRLRATGASSTGGAAARHRCAQARGTVEAAARRPDRRGGRGRRRRGCRLRRLARAPHRRPHRSRQHRHRPVRERDDGCGVRRDAADGAEGAPRPVAVPGHHPGSAHRRDARIDGPPGQRAR